MRKYTMLPVFILLMLSFGFASAYVKAAGPGVRFVIRDIEGDRSSISGFKISGILADDWIEHGFTIENGQAELSEEVDSEMEYGMEIYYSLGEIKPWYNKEDIILSETSIEQDKHDKSIYTKKTVDTVSRYGVYLSGVDSEGNDASYKAGATYEPDEPVMFETLEHFRIDENGESMFLYEETYGSAQEFEVICAERRGGVYAALLTPEGAEGEAGIYKMNGYDIENDYYDGFWFTPIVRVDLDGGLKVAGLWDVDNKLILAVIKDGKLSLEAYTKKGVLIDRADAGTMSGDVSNKSFELFDSGNSFVLAVNNGKAPGEINNRESLFSFVFDNGLELVGYEEIKGSIEKAYVKDGVSAAVYTTVNVREAELYGEASKRQSIAYPDSALYPSRLMLLTYDKGGRLYTGELETGAQSDYLVRLNPGVKNEDFEYSRSKYPFRVFYQLSIE